MPVTSIVTPLKSALLGSAGRSAQSLGVIRDAASTAHLAFSAVLDGSTTASHAAGTLNQVDRVFARSSAQLRDVVNEARPGLGRAFGDGQPLLSGTLHARLGEITSARTILGQGSADAARALDSARFGARSAESLIGTIDGALPKLQSAAHATAAARVGIASIGVGAAIAGALALHHLTSGRGDDGGRIMAPGPFGAGAPGFDPSFDPTGVVI